MERGPFAGFYLVSELPVASEGVQRWAVRHSDGRQGEVLLGSASLLESASRWPQGGPWGVILTGSDESGTWVLLPGELTCSLTQLRTKISAPGAFAVGHLLLEALGSVHDAGEHHGSLSPEWVGFDSEGVLRVRARPDLPGTSDIDPTAGPQDTDCWSVGGLVYFLLGGDWPPTEVVSMPDFGGMDAGRARLALSGLLRKNPRLRLKPARFARQAVAAALQDIEAAEEELRGILAEFGCGGALRDAAPVLPSGLDSDANQALIQAFTNAVAPAGGSAQVSEPLPAPESDPKSRSPIQIELALPDTEEPDDPKEDDSAGDATAEETPGASEEGAPDPVEASPAEEEPQDQALEVAATADPEDKASADEDTAVGEDSGEEDVQEAQDLIDAKILEPSTAEESAQAPEEPTEGDRVEEALAVEVGVAPPKTMEESTEGLNPIRIQIAPSQEAMEPVSEEVQEVGKQPLEVEPFRMPLPESVPADVEEASAEVGSQSASPALKENPSEEQTVRIQMPPPQEVSGVNPLSEPPSEEEESVDSDPILIPQPELPAEAFEDEILSEEELDALLATPIDDDRLEPLQGSVQPPPDTPLDSPSGLSNDELAALEEEADWSLNVEVGTRSDLDEDLGPGKWVESGRSPEELARELDSMPVVDREFDLNPKSAVLPKVLALGGILLLVLVGFSMMNAPAEDLDIPASTLSLERPQDASQIPDGLLTTTVTTNLEHARVSLDGVEFGRAPTSVPIPDDSETHRLCVEYRTQSRCVDLSAEELAARDPFQITVE